jgi:predicted phosphodiesterase
VLRVLIVAILAASCNIPPVAAPWHERGDHLFKTGPYILLGEPGVAYVVVKSRGGPAPVVEWSPIGEGAETKMVTTRRDDDIWVATLKRLPQEKIRYRVISKAGTSPYYEFSAGHNGASTFRFAVYGDTRTHHDVHRAVVERVAKEDIDFLLHTGDMVADGGVQRQWDTFFQIERPLLNHTPIVPSIGNHDESARDYYRHYFLHKRWAKDLRYYSKDWGNLRLVALDGAIECQDGCDQYAFLQKTLQDALDKKMLIVMFLHYPPYSSGAHGSNMLVQETVTNLARKYGVELVIAGHDHNYERTIPIHGTTYVVSGSAGAPIRAVNPVWFTARARTEPHYVLMDVADQRMTLRAINLKGETFDTVVIDAVAPQ